MEFLGSAFLQTLLALESSDRSCGNYMFIDNAHGLFCTEFNLNLSNEPALDDVGRNKMFEEGLKLDKSGKKLEALKCYLKCLVGLKENSRFALLPQCLRNVSML